MPQAAPQKPEEKGTGEAVQELWTLIRDYAKQETIDPLKTIGRFLGYGLAGAVCLGLGLLFFALAVLRGLQHETDQHLTGSLTWVPYLIALVVCAVVVAVAVRTITKPNREEPT